MKKIAIIGAGITGISALHLLKKYSDYDVTLFEKEDRIGGHANPVWVGNQYVDTAFMVYNQEMYPNLIHFFHELGVEKINSNMSIAAEDKNTGICYSSDDVWSKFWYSPSHFKILFSSLRFYRKVKHDLAQNMIDPEISIREYINQNNFNDNPGVNHMILPLVAAIWSQLDSKIYDVSAKSIFDFFNNHKLMSAKQPVWFTPANRSDAYLKAIEDLYAADIVTNAQVESVSGVNRKKVSYRKNQTLTETEFDIVIFSTHSDQTLAVAKSLNPTICRTLANIPYTSNRTVLHTDEKMMPTDKQKWSAWNVVAEGEQSMCSYWLNKLQALDSGTDYIVTLNPTVDLDKEKVIAEFDFAHPKFGPKTAESQKNVHDAQGKDGYYFAGAWLRDGFHEDGIWSAVTCVKALGVNLPEEYKT